ncbi:MAG: aminoglycoside adenylyltransferase domain-containing protein [Phenylobacterium sp.]|uniref:nucleotidyltransferase domain-containing protein n=1 Tax=Phenylobacterium sp. TaxID=1871053 RepID=UPI00391B74C5
MPHREPGAPTPYAELNAVLAHLLDGARAALRGNFVGAYLQGSFAVGDFTEHSDCDFIVVTRQDLSPGELDALQRLHKAIHRLPYAYWRTGLEGSYAPAAILRRWSTTPRDPPGEPRGADWSDPGLSGLPARAYPFWYLDHGADTLVRSEHDNTQVVRWCLRERGVVLAGPPPQALIDPVPPGALRAEVRQTLDLALATGLEPMHLAAWQAFWVGLFCRILHTLETGEVTSKKAAMTWAQGALAPAWRSLIAEAQAMRKGDPIVSERATDPDKAAATRAFALYARERADRGV